METRINASAIKSAIAGRFGIVPSVNDGNVPWKQTEKDCEGNPLEAGALYCKCLIIEDECDAFRYGSLVRYGSDGRFYNVDYTEDGEDDTSDYDFLVRQVAAIDESYIF